MCVQCVCVLCDVVWLCVLLWLYRAVLCELGWCACVRVSALSLRLLVSVIAPKVMLCKHSERARVYFHKRYLPVSAFSHWSDEEQEDKAGWRERHGQGCQ